MKEQMRDGKVRWDNVKQVLLAMQRLSWEQGVAAQAFFECGEEKTGIRMADEAVHRQTSDGRLGVCQASLDAVDCGANGLPVLWAARKTGMKRYAEAAEKMAEWFLHAPKSRDGIVYHNIGINRTMIDGIYHVAPFMAAMGYTDFALDQIRAFRAVHMDEKTKLYFQYYDDDMRAFARKELWGPGIGWMAAALPMTANFVPETQVEEQRELRNYMTELTDACLAHSRPDHLFHDVMDRQDTFVDTGTGIMIACGIYRGIQAGLLKKDYAGEADKIYGEVLSYVDEHGYLQQACASPSFAKPGISAEAQSFLLMCRCAKEEVENGVKYSLC